MIIIKVLFLKKISKIHIYIHNGKEKEVFYGQIIKIIEKMKKICFCDN